MDGCFETNTWKQCSTQYAVKPLNSLGWDIVANRILQWFKKKKQKHKPVIHGLKKTLLFTEWHSLSVQGPHTRLRPCTPCFMYMQVGKGSSCPVVHSEKDLRHGRNVRLPLEGRHCSTFISVPLRYPVSSLSQTCSKL